MAEGALRRGRRWLGGACAAVALAGAALAQPVPGSGTDPDGMQRRTLACTACHGRQGQATPQGYFPRIAGKPAGYLYNQLLNFREGRRSYPQMSYLLEHLTDDYLREMAQHFASLQLPYAPAPAAQLPASLLERGRQLALHGDKTRDIPACVSCHGQALMGVAPWLPGLLGLSRDYVASQLGAWQTGQRHAQAPDCMAELARRLDAQDVGAVAAWLSTQPVLPGAAPQSGPVAELPLRCGGVQGAGP